jgi:hypothetical protein
MKVVVKLIRKLTLGGMHDRASFNPTISVVAIAIKQACKVLKQSAASKSISHQFRVISIYLHKQGSIFVKRAQF